MNLTPRTLFLAAGAFIAAGAFAFFAAQAVAGDDAPLPAAVPTVSVVEPVILPILLSPDEDVAAFAVEHAAQAQASREIASELGVPLESNAEAGAGVGGIEVFDPIPATSDEPPEPLEELPVEEPFAGPPGPGSPGVDTMEDPCADGGDTCPEGVGGTVLLAIRELPPLVGITYFNPSAEPGRYIWTPQCPAIEVPGGSAYFGATTSRPATITVRYRAGRWTGETYEVEGTFTTTTPDGAEGAWADWIADDTAPADDARGWIHHCFLIEDLPPRGDYIAFVDYTDKSDPSINVGNNPTRFDFHVALDGGLVPGEQRRPTGLLGYGIDDLRIGVTATVDHSFQAFAIPDGDPGVCDTTSVAELPGAIRSGEIVDEPIPPERIADPLYPYLRDHTRSLVHRLELQEGTDYMVCLYWFARGTTFNPTVVDIAEAVPVSTPEAFRPRVLVHGITELFGALDEGRITVEGCGSLDFVIEPGYRGGDAQMFDEPVEVCVGDRNLTSLERGMRVVTAIEDTDEGVWRSGGAWIRTPLQCDPVPCLLRLDEYYSIPLPEVPTERRLCGTGFGGGCSGEVPMRPAGSVAMEIEFVRTDGNGRSEWSIGAVGEFDATPAPPVGDVPRLSVSVAWAVRDHPTQGARATVTVTADRDVTFVANTVGEPDCGLDPPAQQSSDTFNTVHTFVLQPLCLGNLYTLEIIAHDRTRGAVGTIIERGGLDGGTDTTLVVPPVLITTEMTTTVQAPINDKAHTMYIRAVNLSVPTAVPPYGTTLDWSWPEADRAAALRSGWQMFGLRGQANACSPAPGAGSLTVNSGTRSALVSQDQITITAVIDIFENHPVGGPYGECAVDRQVDSFVMQATLSLRELMSGGVTLTSGPGEAVFIIRVVHWRNELIG